MSRCPKCHESYSGNGGGHCMACHKTFSGKSAAEAHRTGTHDPPARVCIDVEHTEGWRRTARGWTNSEPSDHWATRD